ncbi:MAG: YdbL family protein [Desulfobulbales bacterium]|nr:YdbL family protein [Desulfobulbales bacterium]
MRKKSAFYTVIALFVLAVFSTEGMCFAGAGDIKARMQERLSAIQELKSAGAVGENNKGFLEFVPGAARKMERVIADENSDREIVYRAIAEQQKTTPELVGERRAKQITERAGAGEWLQDESGKWYKK